MYPEESSISWISSASTTMPSFSISLWLPSLTSWATRSRSLMMLSTVRPPMIDRRWPANTRPTSTSIRSCSDRNRRAAVAVDAPSSPALNAAAAPVFRRVPLVVVHFPTHSAPPRARAGTRGLCLSRGQEPAGRVRDRRLVVADLERGDRPDVQPDALVGDAFLDDLRLAQGQREHAGLLLYRGHEAAVPGDDAELRRLVMPLRAGDQQGLVRRRDMPEKHKGSQMVTAKRGLRTRNEPTGTRLPRRGYAGRWARRTRPRRPRCRRGPRAAPRRGRPAGWRP